MIQKDKLAKINRNLRKIRELYPMFYHAFMVLHTWLIIWYPRAVKLTMKHQWLCFYLIYPALMSNVSTAIGDFSEYHQERFTAKYAWLVTSLYLSVTSMATQYTCSNFFLLFFCFVCWKIYCFFFLNFKFFSSSSIIPIKKTINKTIKKRKSISKKENHNYSNKNKNNNKKKQQQQQRRKKKHNQKSK